MVNLFINNQSGFQGGDSIQNALQSLLRHNQGIPLDRIVGVNSDTFVSASNKIDKVQSGDEYVYFIEPTDEFVYNPNDGKLYLVRNTPLGLIYEVLPDDPELFKLFSEVSGISIPPPRDSQGREQTLLPGDEIVFDNDTGRFFIRRENADGNVEEINIDRATAGDLTAEGAQRNRRTVPPVNVQKEVSRISRNNQTFTALGVPGGLSTAPVNVSGIAPGFGDQTGALIASGIYVEAGLYSQLQKTLSIINYLNTAPAGTAPNPNFSYIEGRPPYGQDTPEGQREQAKVFAALRTNIIAQLTRIAEQLRDAITGFRTQTQAAQSYKQQQDQNISKFVNDAYQGGGGR